MQCWTRAFQWLALIGRLLWVTSKPIKLKKYLKETGKIVSDTFLGLALFTFKVLLSVSTILGFFFKYSVQILIDLFCWCPIDSLFIKYKYFDFSNANTWMAVSKCKVYFGWTWNLMPCQTRYLFVTYINREKIIYALFYNIYNIIYVWIKSTESSTASNKVRLTQIINKSFYFSKKFSRTFKTLQ